MSKRRLVGLSIFASALFAQACLVEACGGDDVMSTPDQPDEDAATADHSVHDGSLGDSTAPGDATASDSASGNDSSTGSDAASDASTLDAAVDAGEDASLDAGADANVDAGVDSGSNEDAGVDSGSTVDGGIDAGPADSGVDAGARYSHTIKIDGTNDFTADETFATTSTGYTGYLAWDDTYLYVGVNGSDVGSASGTKWILVYLSGSAGTTTGLTYDTQQPSLPFPAQYHVRWKADNTYTNAQSWNGSAWTDASWSFSDNVNENGNYFEMRIPLANIGSPTSVSVDVSMINEEASHEATYSGVPSTSFTDAYNPSYTKYLQLDLQGTTKPNASPVLP